VRLLPDGIAGTVRVVSDRYSLPLFVVLWSSGYVVGAVGISVADPLPLLAARFALASVVAVPLALRHGRWRGAPLGRLAVVGILLQVVQFGGVYGGFSLGVPAALAALVILGLSPLVTTGLAVLAGQERADARLWAGLAIGVLGVALSVAPELGTARAGAGIALTLVGMLGLAGGTVLQKRWVGTSDVRVSAAAQSVAAALIVGPVALVLGGRFEVSARLGLSLVWLSWGLGIVAVTLLVHLLRHHAASAVAALLLVVPAVTAVMSALALGETLHPASLVGMLVAAAGVGTVLRREARAPRPPERSAEAPRTGASGTGASGTAARPHRTDPHRGTPHPAAPLS
jgi:drug/metabolite transporter (DMT)-like permease